MHQLPAWLGLSERRWTKAPDQEVQPAKTAWDWLGLLIVPAVLVALGYVFNAAQADRDRAREDRRAQQAQRIAAEDRRDEVLQGYLTRMGELILSDGLRRSHEESDVREVARTLTFTTLRRLDARRKGEVVRFLADSDLIAEPQPILRLANADLDGVWLRGVALLRTNFDTADLRHADFAGASLEGVQFEAAHLEGASFAGAHLAGARFTVARLEGASFRHARLTSGTTYVGALRVVSFAGACVTGATFAAADARRARFPLAAGLHVRFAGARLSAATLSRAWIAESAFDPEQAALLPPRWTLRGRTLTTIRQRRRSNCQESP